MILDQSFCTSALLTFWAKYLFTVGPALYTVGRLAVSLISTH